MKKKPFPKFKSQLETRTLELLAALPRSIELKQVAEATGLSKAWLTNFGMSKLEHPSVGRVETLYVYLSGKPLFPDNAE